MLDEEGGARVSRNGRLSTLEQRTTFVAEKRRELASGMYDEFPGRSGIFDTVLFGYARVSTAEQNPDHQVDALLHAGVAAKDVYIARQRRQGQPAGAHRPADAA